MQDESGKQVTVTMGSYGIGVSRAVAAIAEATYDELGLCWPREVAPADVHIVVAGKDGAPQGPAAEQLADRTGGGRACGCCSTIAAGVSPGVKFKDAELIGVPTIVVVGRGLTDDPATSTIEVKDRRTGTRTDVPLAADRPPPHRTVCVKARHGPYEADRSGFRAGSAG